MTTNDRLRQLWSLLVHSAHAHKVLTDAILVQLLGAPRQAVGCLLSCIQDYCNFHNLPPLTLLVVNEVDGPPNEEFAVVEDVFGERARVYLFDWLSQKSPSPEDIQYTSDKYPNEMPWRGGWQSSVNLPQNARSDRVLDNYTN